MSVKYLAHELQSFTRCEEVRNAIMLNAIVDIGQCSMQSCHVQYRYVVSQLSMPGNHDENKLVPIWRF